MSYTAHAYLGGCEAYAARYGMERVPCCDSCHEDANEWGYDLCYREADDGFYEVCCAIANAQRRACVATVCAFLLWGARR